MSALCPTMPTEAPMPWLVTAEQRDALRQVLDEHNRGLLRMYDEVTSLADLVGRMQNRLDGLEDAILELQIRVSKDKKRFSVFGPETAGGIEVERTNS